ncbi:MAG: nuclear transport factor 2 family protein [Pseudomonadota bacterium]
MSAAENKTLVMEGYRQFQSGDIQHLLERYHDDAEWTGPESDLAPFAGKFHGRQGIAQFFSKLADSVQPIRFQPLTVVAEGDSVVVTGEASWRVKSTGRSYDSAWVHVFTLREGKVATFQSYYDTAACEKAFQPGLGAQPSATAPLHH